MKSASRRGLRRKLVVAIIVPLVLFCIVIPICMAFIPPDFHPKAWMFAIVGLVMALAPLRLGELAQPLRIEGMTCGWLGLIVAIFDNLCPSGYCGFLGTAVLTTASFLATTRYKVFKPLLWGILAAAGLWIAATLLYIFVDAQPLPSVSPL